MSIASANLRVNEQIRLTPVRLIDQDGRQVGIVETARALEMAREAELDLVEVAPKERPPVCRIMDYGKWKYLQKKKDQLSKKKRRVAAIKEVRLRPKTDVHDQQTKIARAREFLSRGDKVQFTVMFRGREMVHRDRGVETLQRITEQLSDVAKVERNLRMEGRRMTILLVPTKPGKPTGGKEGAQAKDTQGSGQAG